MHDKTLQRTTNGKGEVTAATLAELKSLDAGSWKDARFAGEPVPSLEEELMARKGGKCRPVIEIKGKGISKAVVDAVKRAGMVQEASIIAFDATAVKEVRSLEPGIECAWLSSKEPEGTPEQQADAIAAEARECHAVVVNLNYNMLSRELVASLKARNLGVWCWTINDPAVARALMAWGVDAITTDRVDVMLDLRKSLSR